ncbi:MAG TPA: hypothetical protein VND89_08730 [Acidimicrobiales bacterium]|nr:hypothetical protein [Acidimicrobiales bacterium]
MVGAVVVVVGAVVVVVGEVVVVVGAVVVVVGAVVVVVGAVVVVVVPPTIGTTESVTGPVIDIKLLSFNVTVKVKFPLPVGVPETVPLEEIARPS